MTGKSEYLKRRRPLATSATAVRDRAAPSVSRLVDSRRSSPLATILFAMLLGGIVGVVPSAAIAQTTLQELSWVHQSPETVSRFIVYASKTSGDQNGARLINVGKPANPSIVGPNYVYSAVVAVELDEFVAVSAVGYDGSNSGLSVWSAIPPTPPGQPLLIP